MVYRYGTIIHTPAVTLLKHTIVELNPPTSPSRNTGTEPGSGKGQSIQSQYIGHRDAGVFAATCILHVNPTTQDLASKASAVSSHAHAADLSFVVGKSADRCCLGQHADCQRRWLNDSNWLFSKLSSRPYR